MTNIEKILGINFSALRTLQFVFELRSVSKAADKLGLPQSNVSYTIARLRDSFGDPLFVREGIGMTPTDRCKEIVRETSKMLEDFQAVATQADFSPETAEGQVTIACNHYERMIILPEVIGILRSSAPGIQLRVKNSHARGEKQLKRGECDMLIGPLQFGGDKIYKRRVLDDTYVCIMDKTNPLAKTDLTAASIGSANHVSIRFPGGWQPLNRLEEIGVELAPKVELSEYGDIRGYVRGTDLIAIVPNMIADRLESGLHKVELPFEIPLEIDIFWTTRTHLSPLHLWVRSAIASVVQGF